MNRISAKTLENLIFGHRIIVIVVFLTVTLLLGYSLTNLKVDAGFNKLLPVTHEYMQPFLKYRDEFGGANRIVVALTVESGDIFTPAFFDTLKKVTDAVFFIPGVDRASVSSLFTPNVQFTEVVEDGISGGNIVPADFTPTPERLAKVRENLLKSDYVGRLVANDFSGAIISASLLEINPRTGEKLDYIQVSRNMEERIRAPYRSENIGVHIIGFAKVVGDIHGGAASVKLFFVATLILTTVLVWFYMQSVTLTLITMFCSLMAVIWQLGLLPLLGHGIDPMSILMPFLVLAIAVSHAMQMTSVMRAEVFAHEGITAHDPSHGPATTQIAARGAFRRLLVPGGIALASDTIGFLTILFIEIEIVREMAITASIGVAVIILTNLILLPVLLSYSTFDDAYRKRLQRRAVFLAPFWDVVSRVSQPRNALIVLAAGGLLGLFGLWKGSDIRIGDLHAGVPELHADSVYNMDSKIISERFSIGVDVLSVIVETKKDGCIDHEIMSDIDRFAWTIRNVPGVQSVISLAGIAKTINAGWNEGSLKWRELPRNQHMMVQSVAYVPTASGLLNRDCSVMPVLIFTDDHKAETIARIIDAVKHYRDGYAADDVRYLLAGHNIGVMAATNEAVEAAQFPILIYVFLAIIVLCVLTFRSIRAMLCIVIPLAVVSLLSYALMSSLEIGLKVNTLPVVALGVGIGVDYGIYIFNRLWASMRGGMALADAFRTTLETTGTSVVFTALILALGVVTWMFSDLKFQADMGIMLAFMFLVNMLGAILLLPALAARMYPSGSGKPSR
ncbi:MAG: MMPL family transporter [Gammaproteobacteria bacterium]|nr:MMPL family transporter [Gammaproteobacteria bacterium]NNJ84094.1 MMPL family transporter [Gammaproteobacteria bacterium]